MSDESTLEPRAQAAEITSADGAQPPRAQAAAAAQDESPYSREEKARSVLRGGAQDAGAKKGNAAHESHEAQAAIDAQFDPETGELLDEDPAAAQGEMPTEVAAEEAAEGDASQNAETAGRNEEDDDEPGSENEGEKEKGKGKRIRVRRDSLTDRDFAILTLAKDKKISFADAERHLFGGRPPADDAANPAAERAAAQAPQAPQAAPTAPTSAQISERIAALRSERDAAAEGMEMKRVIELNDRLADLRDQLQETRQSEAVQRQAAQQQAQMRYSTVETEAIHRAKELFPEATVRGSELNEALQAKAAAIRGEDPAFFENPRWPIVLTVETAASLGIAPKASAKAEASREAAAKPAVKVMPAIVPKKTTRPAPAPAPGPSRQSRGHPGEDPDRLRGRQSRSRRDARAASRGFAGHRGPTPLRHAGDARASAEGDPGPHCKGRRARCRLGCREQDERR